MHGTLHFLRRARRILRREGGEPGEAAGMARDRLGQFVIGGLGDAGRRIRVEHLHAGRGQRQYVHRDIVGVHVRQPHVEIEQAGAQPRSCGIGAAERSPQRKVGTVPVAMAERDHRRHLLACRERLLGRDPADRGSRARILR